jgi:hypothetical protein
MATTTPNYGWTVPTSTDLVKDGATAIETLGDAIDASMNTALGTKKAGMVLLNTTSFSGVSSQSINDVFSATYENYRVIFTINGPDTNDLFFRIRVGGADLTSSTYQQTQGSTSSSTSITISNTEARGACGYFEIFRPFATDYTHLLARASSLRSTGQWSQWTYAGAVNNTTSYTGFTLFPGSSTFTTGTIRVYGYNN